MNYDLEQKLRERGANLIRQVCKLKYRVSTKKLWRAVAPINFKLGLKVGGVLRFSDARDI